MTYSLNETNQKLLEELSHLSGMPIENVLEAALQQYHQGFLIAFQADELTPSTLMKLPKTERLKILATQAEQTESVPDSEQELWQSGDFLDD